MESEDRTNYYKKKAEQAERKLEASNQFWRQEIAVRDQRVAELEKKGPKPK